MAAVVSAGPFAATHILVYFDYWDKVIRCPPSPAPPLPSLSLSPFHLPLTQLMMKTNLLLKAHENYNCIKTAIKTRWLYCVECPQYSTRLEALGYLCDCVSGRVQR